MACCSVLQMACGLFPSALLLVLAVHAVRCSLDTWPEPYLVVEHQGDVNITCPLAAEKVSWRLPDDCSKHLNNRKTQLLRHVDQDCAGSYTCFNYDDPTQSFTIRVLIKTKDFSSQELKCTADSYTSTHLRCSLLDERFCPCLVRAKAFRGNVSTHWHTVSIPSEEKFHLNFTVPVTSSLFCPYGEHDDSLHVLVEMMSIGEEYLRVESSIGMRDVVVPAAPEILGVDGGKISWKYPSSWSYPHSYYPLLFQVDFRKRNNKKENHKVEELSYNKEHITEFRVKCRDLYNPSATWSEWSKTLRL